MNSDTSNAEHTHPPEIAFDTGCSVCSAGLKKDRDRITLYICECDAPPSLRGGPCRSHPYPARAMGPELQAVEYVPVDDKDPNAAPTTRCTRCGRKSWNRDSIGARCNVPQPNGSVCEGTMAHG